MYGIFIITLLSLVFSIVACIRTIRGPAPAHKPIEYKCPCKHQAVMHSLNPPHRCEAIVNTGRCACQRYGGPKDDFMLMKEIEK